MKAVVDRIEEKIAVLRLDGRELIIHRRFLPKKIQEGDILNVFFALDEKTGERQRAKAAVFLRKIFKKRP